MKVFTVGLDQKPPVEKSESPPPGYVSSTPTPIPMGPEIAPIIVRKSRGYKGILMVMLGVFLMAVFALTLSEIAYNRQRDENFFRLQWAQLKHRLSGGGYDTPDFAHRIIPVNQQAADLAEISALSQKKPADVDASSRTNSGGDTSSAAASSSSASHEEPSMMMGGGVSSAEQQPPHAGGAMSPAESFIRDARLQFLRQILQRIRQNAEEMGFDGTMQVSVIEVEPQQMGEFMANNNGKKPQSPSEDPRSDSFLDSFGEFHAPPPFGAAGGPPPMRELNENSIVPGGRGPSTNGGGPRQWPDMPTDFTGFEMPMAQFAQAPQASPFRPDLASMMAFRPPPPPPPPMPEMEEPWGMMGGGKSAEFPGASPAGQEIMGEIYGRKFGRMLQDLIAARIQNSLMQQQQQQQAPAQMMMPNLIMPMRPSFPIESGAPQAGWWDQQQQQQQQMMGQSQQQPQQQQQVQFPPPPPPPMPVNQEMPHQQAQQPNPTNPANQQQVAQQAGSESTGQSAQAPSAQLPNSFPQPQFPVFVSPEDRIQIEPPNGGVWQGPSASSSADSHSTQSESAEEKPSDVPPPPPPHAILDFMPPPRAWTHQSEVIDFPAVKFPQMSPSEVVEATAAASAPMNDPASDSAPSPQQQQHQSGIFFQVDEPQQHHLMVGAAEPQPSQHETAQGVAAFV